MHTLDDFAIDLAEHQVAFFVLEWVVQARIGALLQTLNKRLNFVDLRVRHLDHVTALKGIYQVHILTG